MATQIRTVKPVITKTRIPVGELRPGEWALWQGNFYVCLVPGQLAGPVGSTDILLSYDTEVTLVELRAV